MTSLLRRAAVLVTVALALLTLVHVTTAAPAAAAEPGVEAEFVAAVNRVRADNGRGELQVHPELVALARDWSARMAAEGGIRHNPNLGQVGADWVLLGENVGVGYDVPTLMQAFVDSPSHLRNLVEPSWDHIGVGVTRGADGRIYTAHVFMDLADVAAAAPAPPPAPPTTTTAPAPAPAAVPVPAPTTSDAPDAPPAPAMPEAEAEADRIDVVLAATRDLGGGIR